MMIIATICFSFMSAMVKFLGHLPVMEIILFRSIPIMLIIPLILDDKLVFKSYLLPNNSAKRLVQKLRNEAHRFAQRYHNILVKKTLFSKT